MIVRWVMALCSMQPSVLVAATIAGGLFGQDPSLDGRVCTSWTEFQGKVEALRAEAEIIEPKLLSGFTKIIAGGEKESTSIAELALVLEEVSKRLLVCKTEREQALKDIELYRAELAELTDIAKADAEAYDWTTISLLGTRAESHTEPDQSERVHRAAEMHVGLASTAKKVAACKKQEARKECAEQMGSCPATSPCVAPPGCRLLAKPLFLDEHGNCCPSAACPMSCEPDARAAPKAILLQQTPDLSTNSSGLSTFNFSNFTTSFNMSTECKEEQEVLVRLYKIAYVHISGLLQTALVIAQDDVCSLTVYQMLQERRMTIDITIREGRREICEGITVAADATTLALQMKSKFEETFSDFNGRCADASYTQFYQALLELVTLSQTSPKITDSSFCSSLGQSASLLQAGQDEDALIDELERQIVEAHKPDPAGLQHLHLRD